MIPQVLVQIVGNQRELFVLAITAVEAAVVGKPRNDETAEMAGKLAIQGAQPLQYNGYKVPLLRNLVKRAIRGTAA